MTKEKIDRQLAGQNIFNSILLYEKRTERKTYIIGVIMVKEIIKIDIDQIMEIEELSFSGKIQYV